MIFIGIDPGLKGALASIRTVSTGNGSPQRDCRAWPVPLVPSAKGRNQYDLPALREWLFEQGPLAALFATVEQSGPLPPNVKAGSLAQYNRGISEGWLWMLTALRIAHQGVRPRTWQKVMHAGTKGADTKQKSIVAAQRLFPNASLKRTERSRKDDDGMAEALLLAEYGRRTHGNSHRVD